MLRCTHRLAFTLVELSVSLALISILVSLLIPGLGRAREQARQTVCQSHQRQLYLAFVGYELLSGTFPHAFENETLRTPPGGGVGEFMPDSYGYWDRYGWWWFHYLTGSIGAEFGDESIIRCPSRNISELTGLENPLLGNYGVNQQICRSSDEFIPAYDAFAGTPLGLDKVVHPARTFLLVDSGYSMIHWWHATDSPSESLTSLRQDTAYIPGLEVNLLRTFAPYQTLDALDGRHLTRTVNACFVDGHVANLPSNDFYVESTAVQGIEAPPASTLWNPSK